MKHKHHDIIVAWAADTTQVLECRSRVAHGGWVWTPVEYPQWSEDCDYRIKPQPKPDVVCKGIIEFTGDHFRTAAYRTIFRVSEHFECDNIHLTFDGETGKLKSAEVLL